MGEPLWLIRVMWDRGKSWRGSGAVHPDFLFCAVPRSRYNRGMSRRRTKAQQEKPIAEIKEASAKWNAMSRRKRYVLIAVAVLTVLFSAFVSDRVIRPK